MSTPVIKICGLTHPDDMLCAVQAGATHVGLVFAPGRRRTVDRSLWLELMDASSGAHRVGVFQGNAIDEVVLLSDMWALSAIQLHGGYSAADVAYCLNQSGSVVWWAQQPEIVAERLVVPQPPAGVTLVVVDSSHAGQFGGTGSALPWGTLVRPDFPFLIAGGLTPYNVGDAIRALQPDGVDTSSGVEDPASSPRKSHDAMRTFISAASAAMVSRETAVVNTDSSPDTESGYPGETP